MLMKYVELRKMGELSLASVTRMLTGIVKLFLRFTFNSNLCRRKGERRSRKQNVFIIIIEIRVIIREKREN